ncbi:lipid-A-disaccharide synthase N-terminal domain-containing protein [Mesorhizobium sp. CN2-181]|uniref:lipid-A-disaccharide synthase N-terminal domain-containing protein n=1 Tax=Mesorhizobium yinganensis TaxID=3157707 RepID=UPI0032B78BEE
MTSSTIWLGIGLVGQALFFMRFLVQWIASERSRRSVVPRAFWYFSILGGLTLLAYAIRQRDIVFTIGQATGIFIYTRNIYLSRPQPQLPEPVLSET